MSADPTTLGLIVQQFDKLDKDFSGLRESVHDDIGALRDRIDILSAAAAQQILNQTIIRSEEMRNFTRDITELQVLAKQAGGSEGRRQAIIASLLIGIVMLAIQTAVQLLTRGHPS